MKQATIVVPVWNQRRDWLDEAIASALGQTVPVEVIVVDDGSDVPVEVPSPVRLVRMPWNQGIAAALNAGIAEMTTEWFCWLSSDDLLRAEKVEKQIPLGLASFHRYDKIGDNAHGFDVSPACPWADIEEQRRYLKQGCWINGSTVMLHRSVFDRVGKFDPQYRIAQDWEMWRRVGEHYLWAWHPDVLGTRRETYENLTMRTQANGPARRARDAELQRVRERTYA